MSQSHLTTETVDGVEIAVADYRGCTPDEFLRRLRITADWVVRQPSGSVLMLTLAAGVSYSPDGMHQLVNVLRETKPYMRASAAVGLGHLTLLIRVINHLAGRGVQAFDSVPDAKRFLVESAKRHDGA